MGTSIALAGNVACASGATLDPIAKLMFPCTADAQIDGKGSLTVTVPADAYYRAELVEQRVVRVTTDIDGTREYRITSISDGEGPGRNRITITADPIRLDLRAIPIVQVIGGMPSYRFTASLTPTQWLDNYAIPACAAWGMSWIQRGTVESSQVVRLEVDGWSVAQLVDALVAETGLEFDFRRNGDTDYRIDLLTEVGSTASVVDITAGRNLRVLDRDRLVRDLATRIVARGRTPDGGLEADTLAESRWKVTAESSGTVTLADPEGGADPFPKDDMLNGRYLLKRDGTLTQITDTIAPNQVVVASSANIAIGDHIGFRENSSGDYITWLEDPAAAQQPPAGKMPIVGFVSDEELRGEANEILNPFASDWTPTGDVLQGAFAATAFNVTSVSLKGLTAWIGEVITANQAVLQVAQHSPGFPDDFNVEITGGGTVDGSGNVTLTLARPIHTTTDVAVTVYRIGALPTGWGRDAGAIVQHFDRTAEALSGTVDGTQNNVRAVALALGAPNASKVVAAGSSLIVGSVRHYVLGPATADGSGDVTVRIAAAASFTNAAAVTIRPPQNLSEFGGNNGWLLPFQHAAPVGSTLQPGRGGLLSPTTTIRYTDAVQRIYVRAGVTVAGQTSAVELDPVKTIVPPSIALVDTSDDSTLASAYMTLDPPTLEPGAEAEHVLGLPYDLSATTGIRVGIAGCREKLANHYLRGPGGPATVGAWVMVHLGFDPSPDPRDGSHGNDLWHLAANRVTYYARDQRMFVVKLRDLASVSGYTAADEKLVLGGTVRLVSELLGEDRQCRIVAIKHDLLDPENTEIVLDTLETRLTQRRRGGTGTVLSAGSSSSSSTSSAAASTETAAVSAEDVAGEVAVLVKQIMQQSGVSGAPGSQYSAMPVRDSAGALTLLDPVLRQLLNADVDGASNTIAGLAAGLVSRGTQLWTETFEVPISSWVNHSGSGTETYPLDGQAGGKVYQAAGERWKASPFNIAFNPRKLYRITGRARRTATTDATKQFFYLGVEGIAADGVTRVNVSGADSHGSQHYIAAAAVDASAWPLNAWQEFTGWIKGSAATGSGVPGTATSPSQLHQDAKYFRPLFIANYNGGPAGNVMQVDDITVEVMDEDAITRAYLALTLLGHLASGVENSQGKLLANAFIKALAASNDTADQIPAGIVNGMVLLSALTSGQVDLTKAGVIGKYLTSLARSSGDSTLASTIVQYLTNGGHAGASMENSQAKLLALLFAKALAASNDTADQIPNGVLKNIPGVGYVDANGRVYNLRDTDLGEDDTPANLRGLIALNFTIGDW